jgi:hypothetical protein
MSTTEADWLTLAGMSVLLCAAVTTTMLVVWA